MTCKAEVGEINLACAELAVNGKAGASAIQILKELGAVIAKVTESTGTIRLIVSAAQDVETTRLDLNIVATGAALPNGAAAWDIPLAGLKLSARAKNILEKANATTLGELASMTEEDLRGSVRGVGARTISELGTLLLAYGLEFGMSEKPKLPPVG